MAPSKIMVALLLALALLADAPPSAAIRLQAAFKPENPASTTGAEATAEKFYLLPPRPNPFAGWKSFHSSSPAGAPTPSPSLGT